MIITQMIFILLPKLVSIYKVVFFKASAADRVIVQILLLKKPQNL